MGQTCIDTADAIELTETLQLIARWLASDPARLTPSLLDFIGHPAHGRSSSARTWTASPSSSAAPTARDCSARASRRSPRRHRLQDFPPGQPRRHAVDEVRRSARSVRVHLRISTCTVTPADLVSLQVCGGRPPLIAAPCRPQGNKLRGAMENFSYAALERCVVTEMPVSQPKTSGELTRVPVPDNSRNGCGRTSSRLTDLAGLHVASLACASTPPSRCSHQSAVISRCPVAVKSALSQLVV